MRGRFLTAAVHGCDAVRMAGSKLTHYVHIRVRIVQFDHVAKGTLHAQCGVILSVQSRVVWLARDHHQVWVSMGISSGFQDHF
jgi:hypothetical protein